MLINLKLNDYITQADKESENSRLSVTVSLDDILMIIPKYAFGYWYRADGETTDKNKLPQITRIYDHARYGLDKLPFGFVAVMYNGTYIPFTSFSTRYGEPINIYDHIGNEEKKRMSGKSVIDKSALDWSTSVKLAESYYTQFSKPYNAENMRVMDSLLSSIRLNVATPSNTYLIVRKDQTGGEDTVKWFNFFVNPSRINKFVNSLNTGYSYEKAFGDVKCSFAPGVIFRTTASDVALQNLQLITGQAVEMYGGALKLDLTPNQSGAIITETSFAIPIILPSSAFSGDDIVERNMILKYNTEDFFFDYIKRLL